jgi:hypothetical protein
MIKRAMQEVFSPKWCRASYFVAGLASMAIGTGLHFNIDSKFQTCNVENLSCNYDEEMVLEDVALIGGLTLSAGTILEFILNKEEER